MPADANLIRSQIAWAHRCNGYARLAGSPADLEVILEPARAEYRRTGRVPEWCGVDLLRGWAFYLTRMDRHWGGYGLEEGGSLVQEWQAVMAGLAAHEDAAGDDVPPMEARSG